MLDWPRLLPWEPKKPNLCQRVSGSVAARRHTERRVFRSSGEISDICNLGKAAPTISCVTFRSRGRTGRDAHQVELSFLDL